MVHAESLAEGCYEGMEDVWLPLCISIAARYTGIAAYFFEILKTHVVQLHFLLGCPSQGKHQVQTLLESAALTSSHTSLHHTHSYQPLQPKAQRRQWLLVFHMPLFNPTPRATLLSQDRSLPIPTSGPSSSPSHVHPTLEYSNTSP
jgi:hypothetical protein